MRPTTNSAVNALLASRQPYIYADVFTFEFRDGLKYYYTNSQQDVVVIPYEGGTQVRYLSNSIKVSGAKMSIQVGTNVDEQEVRLDYHVSDEIYGMPWPQAIRWGYFDNCIIKRDRFVAPSWNTDGQQVWTGGFRLFMGRMGNATSVGRYTSKIQVKSYLVLANIQMPKELQQPGCNNTVYDSSCGLIQAAFTFTGAAGSGSNASIINWSASDTKFTKGIIQFASGANAGLPRTIKQATSTQLFLANPLQYEPGVGDVFQASYGCDKTMGTCLNTFNNIDPTTGVIRHRGFPYVPTPETAY